MPVPVLTSEAPVPPELPPSTIEPATLARRLLEPTVSCLLPSRKVPAPSIEPAVMPLEVRPEMSTTLPALAISRAWPPVLVPMNAVLEAAPLLVTVALPAVALSAKVTVLPLPLLMVALPAEALSWKRRNAPPTVLMIVALPADELFWKVVLAPAKEWESVAFPAVLELLKRRSPAASMLICGRLDEPFRMPLPRNWKVVWTEKV